MPSERPSPTGPALATLAALLLAAGLIVALVGGDLWGQPTSRTAGAPTPAVTKGGADPSASGVRGGSALAALSSLAVKGRAPRTGYDRALFGQAWADVDHNGCDTRNDVLHRDLTAIQVRPGTHDCVVVAGTLADPYTGTTVAFTKAHADQVQIDHVVPLAAAWTQGAATWTAAQRAGFANDPANLIATESGPNESKGDDTADEWVPPNAAFGCAYARVIVTVKQHYALSVTPAEQAALRRLLATC
jgi:hypothetical protein